MTETSAPANDVTIPDSGLVTLSRIAAYYRIAADPAQLAHVFALGQRAATSEDLVRAAKSLGLKARIVRRPDDRRLRAVPMPAVVQLARGGFAAINGPDPEGRYILAEAGAQAPRLVTFEELCAVMGTDLVLVTRRIGGAGADPETFGFRWFLPSIWRYRRPLGHVLLASLFVQLFALVTPLFFQIVVDKVLVHKGVSTLTVIVIGMIALGFFDVVLQYLRTYALSHTTNRIDVELGRRLFHHLMRLPMSYFETRAAGQTVARVRELESIRSFLTGQGLTSAIDLLFVFVFIAVLFAYSWFLALIVVASAPLYMLVAALVRPILRERIKEKFNRGAESQQFLVETVVGVGTLKAAAVEPMMQAQWEERLAAYVKTAFDASLVGAIGQNTIQYISKIVTALIILFGAQAVIEGTMTVGALVAFNMIANQAIQPILRLSQLFQDFQQVQVSVDRLGDILNSPPEKVPQNPPNLPPARGQIELKTITFRYRPGLPEAVKGLSLGIRAGEVVGIVGPSGSGKSTLTKLMQRLYVPEEGQVLLDGVDVAQLDPAWLRRQIGVVLQENLLFNRTLHDNIALANPAMPRAQVMRAAKLSGADEFIAKLPQGYDTMIEERGANLSGGQRQRIAIARSLVTNPRILIFDEATSALDYESERVIQRNMREIVKGRTVVIIAHRLAAVRNCDRIVGMHEGRIVEIGTHDQLVKREKGLYAHLWALQTDQAQATGAAS